MARTPEQIAVYKKAWYEANRERQIALAKAWKEANRERNAATDKAYREATRELREARHKAWRAANPERWAAYRKAWCEANPERNAATFKAWYEANRERRAAYGKAYYEANREQKLAYTKGWSDANPERRKASGSARRARKKEQLVETVDYAAVFKRDKGRCQCEICYFSTRKIGDEPWHVDHIIPISLGGPHSYANVRLAHAVCNLRRNAATNETLQLRLVI